MKHSSIELAPHKLDAILCNAATQLQVPLNLQPKEQYNAIHQPNKYRKGFQFYRKDNPASALGEFFNPFGNKGDLLYVKEEWSTIGPTSQSYLLKATTPEGSPDDLGKSTPWQPARTMPKHLARYWLKIEHIAMQRVQDITTEQALAEGPTRCPKYDLRGFKPAYVDHSSADEFRFCLGPKATFKQLFKANYGKLAWDKNFWCWVLTFNRVDAPNLERERNEEGYSN